MTEETRPSWARTPERMLLYAELAARLPDRARLDAAMRAIRSRLEAFNDGQLAAALRLGVRVGHVGLSTGILAHLAGRKRLSPQLAFSVLEMAHNLGDDALADRVEEQLRARLHPPHVPRFQVQAARLRHGPDAALAALRRIRAGRRSVAGAAEIGRLLTAAGEAGLALRYLRLCTRKWPAAPKLRTGLMEAFLAAGQPGAAHAWLDRAQSEHAGDGIDTLRLRLALETDDRAEAERIMDREVKAGRRRADDASLLRVRLALGRFEEAEDVARAMRRGGGLTSRQAAHFGVNHAGALLNEARLYRAAMPRDASAVPGSDLAAANFFAAKDVLDHWRKAHPWREGVGTRAATLVRCIWQYWNAVDVPPAIGTLMATWRSSGWAYRRFHRRDAMDWLRETCGEDHLRAFRLANHVAEESDFLRLCLLQHAGGLYADADDRGLAGPDAIAALGPGLVVFAEPGLGSIQNNLLYAPKGHPVIARAAEMAREALLRGDNDNTWSKTGPGLLTRAVAEYVLRHPEKAAQTVTIVPRIHVHGLVQQHVKVPHKSRPTHWNAKSAAVPEPVKTALAALAVPRA